MDSSERLLASFSLPNFEYAVSPGPDPLGQPARVDDCGAGDVPHEGVEVGRKEEDMRGLVQQREICHLLDVEVNILAWRIERVETALLEDMRSQTAHSISGARREGDLLLAEVEEDVSGGEGEPEAGDVEDGGVGETLDVVRRVGGGREGRLGVDGVTHGVSPAGDDHHLGLQSSDPGPDQGEHVDPLLVEALCRGQHAAVLHISERSHQDGHVRLLVDYHIKEVLERF